MATFVSSSSSFSKEGAKMTRCPLALI